MVQGEIVQERLPSGELPKAKRQAMLNAPAPCPQAQKSMRLSRIPWIRETARPAAKEPLTLAMPTPWKSAKAALSREVDS